MSMPDERPVTPVVPPQPPGGTYSLHPVAALDGVFIYVSLNGETVGYYFGQTEEIAAAAVALDVMERVSDNRDEVGR